MNHTIKMFKIGDTIPEGSKFIYAYPEIRSERDPAKYNHVNEHITMVFFYEVPVKEK